MTQNEKIGEKPDLIHLLNVIILYSNILTYSYPYNIVYTKLYPKFQSLPFWVHCETTQQLCDWHSLQEISWERYAIVWKVGYQR